MENKAAASAASTLSWNTFLSRTSVSSLSCAVFSEQQGHVVHGLEDIIRAVRALRLRHISYKDITREESLGEGETYRVERCIVQGSEFAIKYLKTNITPGAGAATIGATNATDATDATAKVAAGGGREAIKKDVNTFRRRLRSVILELQIMRHGPIKNHPNFPGVVGYGWNTQGASIVPYLILDYAPLGTLRQYLKSRSQMQPRDIEILTGDVAAALTALHTCGIVHGDVKLDNVLVTPSWDRPCKTLVKLTDFGHALIMNDKSQKNEDGPMRYSGTLIYNAPEVREQDLFPIDRADLPKCDVWAFGILIWEACIQGEEYLSYLEKNHPQGEAIASADVGDHFKTIEPADLRKYAIRSVPGSSIGPALLIRASLRDTIQEDPSKRISDLQKISIVTKWHASGLSGLEADLALHLESPSPTFEMFRSVREIPWAHEKQIFNGLKQTHTGRLTKDIATFIWQIALCYHAGFGTAMSAKSAHEYAHKAMSEGHPVAKVFADLFDPGDQMTLESLTSPAEAASPTGSTSSAADIGDASGASGASEQQMTSRYATRISALMRQMAASQSSSSTQEMPPLVKACYNGNADQTIDLLLAGANPNSSTPDGCTAFHWLFMFQEQETLHSVVKKFRSTGDKLLVDAPFYATRQVHDQWPLQLSGSPLSVHISINDLKGVRALLSLGANPLSLVYCEGKFPPDDPRSQWTALHLAAEYHCSEILEELLDTVGPERCKALQPPLACVLSFSTVLERFAMHGGDAGADGQTRIRSRQQLDRSIEAIRTRALQPLNSRASNGMTALMQAIDFQDHEVVAALLRAEPSLSTTKLCSPSDERVFNLPVHFAAQIAARRDVPESLLIPQIIDKYSDDLSRTQKPPRDELNRTPLHLAVTGPSSRAAEWILERRPGLLHVEDLEGRTPLHYCASVANCDLLLSRGARVDHTDKYGMTALHRAASMGEPELVASLLRKEPNLALHNNRFGTSLHCAVKSGSLDVVMALLDAGSAVDAVDLMGNTPVHVAARMDRHVILRTLMQRGANISIKNRNSRDARQIAAAVGRHGNVGVLRVLARGRETADTQQLMVYRGEQHGNYPIPSTDGFSRPRNGPPDFAWDADDDTQIPASPIPDGPSSGEGGFFPMGGRASEGSSSMGDAIFSAPRETSTSDWGDWSELGDYQATEESFDDRDKRMARLVRTVDAMSEVYVPIDIGVHNNSRMMLETMDLVSVFFDDAIWQPPHSSKLVEIMGETARDLAMVMDFSYSFVKRHLMNPYVDMGKSLEWLRKHDRHLLLKAKDTSASSADAPAPATTTTTTTWTKVTGRVRRTSPTGAAGEPKTPPAGGEKTGSSEKGTPPYYQPIGDPSKLLLYFTTKAASYVAVVAAKTKPSWVLPGRTEDDLENMIAWEMAKWAPPQYYADAAAAAGTGLDKIKRRFRGKHEDNATSDNAPQKLAHRDDDEELSRGDWPEKTWAFNDGPRTAKVFPELFRGERGSERYRRWIQLREKAAAANSSKLDAEGKKQSELEKWRRGRDGGREPGIERIGVVGGGGGEGAGAEYDLIFGREPRPIFHYGPVDRLGLTADQRASIRRRMDLENGTLPDLGGRREEAVADSAATAAASGDVGGDDDDSTSSESASDKSASADNDEWEDIGGDHVAEQPSTIP